jgi:hypothetical protein
MEATASSERLVTNASLHVTSQTTAIFIAYAFVSKTHLLFPTGLTAAYVLPDIHKITTYNYFEIKPNENKK